MCGMSYSNFNKHEFLLLDFSLSTLHFSLIWLVSDPWKRTYSSKLNVSTSETHNSMPQWTGNLNSLAFDYCTSPDVSLVFWYVCILFKWASSYVIHSLNQSQGLNILRFTSLFLETHGDWNCCNLQWARMAAILFLIYCANFSSGFLSLVVYCFWLSVDCYMLNVVICWYWLLLFVDIDCC